MTVSGSYPRERAGAWTRILRATGAGVALIGGFIVLAWFMHWTLVVQAYAGAVSVKLNTGLCFMLCGSGVALVATRHARWAAPLGAAVGLIAVWTLLEYTTRVGWSIDEQLHSDYLQADGIAAGRMSPLTALCFSVHALQLLIAGSGKRTRERLLVIALLACAVTLISCAAVLGYAFDIDAAFGVGIYARMAAPTGFLFLLLAAAILGWSWREAQSDGIDLMRWLPAGASVTLMALVALGCSISLSLLQTTIDWRKHSYEVLLTAQGLLGELADTQRGMRGYVLTGQSEALGVYRAGVKSARQTIFDLAVLTQDNPAQEARAKALARDVQEVLTYARRLIEARDTNGLAAAAQLENTGNGLRVMDRLRDDLQAFSDAEHQLLVVRETAADRNFRGTTALVVAGSALAVLLLALAHLLADRELVRRRRADAKLGESLALQSAILDSAPYAIVSFTVRGVVTSFNPAAERSFGHTAAEVIGRATPALWHDALELEARASVLSSELCREIRPGIDCLTANTRPGQSDEGEWTFLRRDGSRFQGSLVVSALTDAKGAVIGYLAVVTDISERVQRLAELRLSEERFRRAFDDAPIGMALVSPRGRWLKVNRGLCEMLQRQPEGFLGIDAQSVNHPSEWESTARLMGRTLAGEIPGYQAEKRYVRSDGGLVDVRVNVSLARDQAGEPLYFIAQIEDVTHRRQVERIKREFISTVSHELRTPLTSIRGSLGLLAAGALGSMSEKAQSMVRIAHQNSERLVRIINDILDIEKIEAGKLDLRLTRVALGPLLAQAIENHQAYADKYQVQLVLEPVPEGEDVLADADRLIQVLANLLSNAAKFSPAGAEVRVRTGRSGNRVRIEVQDRGTGIPEEFRARVFEKFAQADGSSSRRFEGTGLGLSITRQLIEAMGGTIGFETETGQGTTFHFELPLAAADLVATPAPSEPSETGRWRVLICRDEPHADGHNEPPPRILHVEDDLDLSRVIGTALDGRAEIVAAPTLQDAQRLLRDESFALVVLDLKLPDGDGLTLLERMPNLTKNPPPVVVLSVAEVPLGMKQRVAASIVKSRVSETHIVETILSLVRGGPPADQAEGLESA